jgi:adenosylmethionine-8-amino-7-oxononanoate aminotransferase
MMHGPTFMANPLACAVASASIDLLESGDPEGRIAKVGSALLDALAPARELPSVVDVRGIGAVGVVELDREVDGPAVSRAALERGVWVRPFRNLVYSMPPYIASGEELARIGKAIVGAIAEVHP